MRVKATVILVSALLLLSFLAIPIHQVHAATTKLVITPSTTTKGIGDVGSTFSTAIDVVNVTGLYGFDLNVTWNNTLITLNSASHITELNAIWGTNPGWFMVPDPISRNVTGSYRLAAASLQNSFTKIGSQALFTLTFRVLGVSSNNDKTTSIHFSTNTLADADSNPIANDPSDGQYTMTGTQPAIFMDPTNATCKIFNTTGKFDISLRMTSGVNVAGFQFEIDFNTTLLNYTGYTRRGLDGIITVTDDEVNGKIKGSIGPSTPISGSQPLLNITLIPSYFHVWKNMQAFTTWQNKPNGTIFYQEANLTYSSEPTLRYVRGSIYQISVGADVAYHWNPKKGDCADLNGVVDITDLTGMAQFYDITPSSGYWTEKSLKYDLTKVDIDKIDLFDLIVIASNFGK